VGIAVGRDGNEQLALAAGHEEHIDPAGEERTDAGDGILELNGIITGGQDEPCRTIDDQQRKPVARPEQHHLWRGEIVQPEGEGDAKPDRGHEKDRQRRAERLPP
jgi:hypothetical protein